MSKDDSFEALEKQLAKDALEKALKGVPPRKPRNKVVELWKPCVVRLTEASTF